MFFANLPSRQRYTVVSGTLVAVLTCCVICYLAVERWAPPQAEASQGGGLFDAPYRLNRLLIEAVEIADPRPLRTAHQLCLVLLGGIALLELGRDGRWSKEWISRVCRFSRWLIVVGLCVLIWLAAIICRQSPEWVAAGLGCGAVGYFAGPWLRRRVANHGFALLSAGLVLGSTAAAWSLKLDFSRHSWESIERDMAHWLNVISHADRMYHGAELFHSANPVYGQLTAMLSVALQRVFGEFSLCDYTRLILALETMGLLVLAVVYFRLAKGRWLPVVFPLLHAGYRGACQGVRGGLAAADWADRQELLQPFDRRAVVDGGQMRHQVDRSAAAVAPPPTHEHLTGDGQGALFGLPLGPVVRIALGAAAEQDGL